MGSLRSRNSDSSKPGVMGGLLTNSGVNLVTGGIYKCDKEDTSFYCRLLKFFNTVSLFSPGAIAHSAITLS
jgi:hypothetical protein